MNLAMGPSGREGREREEGSFTHRHRDLEAGRGANGEMITKHVPHRMKRRRRQWLGRMGELPRQRGQVALPTKGC